MAKTEKKEAQRRTPEHLRALDAITDAQIDLGRAKFILDNWLDSFDWSDAPQIEGGQMNSKACKWMTGFKETQTSIFIIHDYVFKALAALREIERIG